ncbi:MAG: TIGR01212 family radical SAM protein [Agitococcus sp.]|nr:TIGR01212 family radical SAM protein [Moraxellaceae bacterium]MBP9215847.1 TIGR01212 family radical SAM protein [Agitococcus sp.]HQV79637.1 TIGR01212 family radical SAM protein [Agitococcus sp.]
MDISFYVNTLGQSLLAQYGQRVHKVALNVGFTCPNRDGSKGTGGCTFCNNASFSPEARLTRPLAEQLASGGRAVHKITGARKLIAYFQAYTNTYADIERLRLLYEEALEYPDVIGLSIGTRPDCVPQEVLDLLCEFQQKGHDIWLELGLQSAFNDTLKRVNRGHGLEEYAETAQKARAMGLKVCTHLILGLPNESLTHAQITLSTVLGLGTDGLKLHPLHVVKATKLAHEWRLGQYEPLTQEDYIEQCIDLITHTPPDIVFHRLTGTAPPEMLITPAWCQHKWPVINGIAKRLAERGLSQGSALGQPWHKRSNHLGIAV